ncbi:MAG: ATP-binding protein [Anaerolineae bacterium]|nr:ATP-binding protein [Anaerolineae bacterium]
MATRLANRLTVARRSRFVGRAAERALLRSTLAVADLPFHVLHIFGPGGVGKTTLLNEFAAVCEESHTPAYYLDARNIEPVPDSFIGALRLAMNLPPHQSPLDVLASHPRHHAILVDTYEILAPLDAWLRDTFLPQLPENTLIVLAGRNPPSTVWYTDPGWQALVRVLPLRNLSPEESREYLAGRMVPLEEHAAVLDFTHGHPLALSLVADVMAQRGAFHFQPEAAPDVVKKLLEQFVQKVPGPAHRAALESCALVRLTTEALLAEMLAIPDVHELFNWLRELSFVQSGPMGLFPHDLAREALVADLRWRNPDWYAELHRRARVYYTTRLQQTSQELQQRVLFDLIFLHRENAMVRPFLEWQMSGTVLTDAMREADRPSLLALVRQHEGDESAYLAAHWFARQPQGVMVFREAAGRVVGFVAMVALHQAGVKDWDLDPAAGAVWRCLQRRAPLRAGELATFFRFWLAADTYQAVSPIQSLIFVNVVRHYLTTPGLAFTFFPCAEPDFWSPMFAYADLARLPEADFEVGGWRYGVYGHDWRAMPPASWLAMLAAREIAAAPQAATPPLMPEPLIVLSQADFAGAARDALRDYPRPDALRSNPLLRSRLVVEQTRARGGNSERIAALQALVREASESLQSSPREAKLYRALYHTYLHPAPTQEQAAELLDLPFSTYRRHLKEGIARVADFLWQRETGGLGK